MTGAAGYTNAIRSNELIVVVISRVFVETFAVPFLARFLVEFRIWKKPKTKDAGRFAVNGFVDACRFRFHFLIEPQTKFIRLTRRAETRFIYETESLEALTAWKFSVVEHLQKIHQPVAVLRGVIPKMLVAAAPEVPSVAPHDFLGREIDAAVHWFKNIGGDLRKVGGTFAGCLRLVDGLAFRATDESHARKKPAPDSRETENIVPAFSQRLHRATIDMMVWCLLARKFGGVLI